VVPWVIVGLLLGGIIAALYRGFRGPVAVPAASAVQAAIELPKVVVGFPQLSPDGRYVVLRWLAETRFLVRRLADGETLRLPGTEQTVALAWSPNSRSLAVLADREIKVLDLATGGIRSIGRAAGGFHPAAAWSGDDLLLGGPRLRRMSVVDGHIRDMYPTDADVSFQDFPAFLPDGRTFLFSQESGSPARRGVFLGTLDSSPLIRVLPDPASVAVSPRGYLLYGRKGSLFAERFDLEKHRVVGDPVSVASGVAFLGPSTQFDLTSDTLIWVNETVDPPARLIWFDRNGRRLNEVGDVQPYVQLALSPDAQRVLTDEAGPDAGLFVTEVGRPIHARLTASEDRHDIDMVWSPDGREIAFSCGGGVCRQRIDQVGWTKLFASANAIEDWTHDGRFLLLGPTMTSVSALPLTGGPKPISIIESSAAVDEPRVSRDGRWLAYSAYDTGQWEVYVQPFMRPGGRVRVSTNGGSQARWRADGRELFYLAVDGTMMSVDVTNPLMPGAPRKLFESRLVFNGVSDQYDVTADGQRFLMIVSESQQATRLTVLTNWPSVLTAR
jgi:eukaryotic-like serine/threonine-protein kinase